MKKWLEYLVKFLFDFLDIFFVRKKYIVFGARAANDYADNSKVLFEYFLAQQSDEVFFYTKKKKVLSKIPKNGIYAYSLKAIIILLKARILIFTHGSKDFFPYSPNKHSRRVFINLFHAIAVKKVSTLKDADKIKDAKKWDYFLASSQFESTFIRKHNDLKESQIIILGQPRNDVLVKSASRQHESPRKRILYAPTFRDKSNTILFPFSDRDLVVLDDFLEHHDMEIVIRLHINDEKRYRKSDSYSQMKRIYFSGAQETPSINDVLWTFDKVISDYSSIVIDYFLLNRPVAYVPYDFEEYDRERGFSFDYHTHRAGPVIGSQKELCSFLLEEDDEYDKKRVFLRNLFHEHQDGRSSERLYNFITNL